MAGSPNPWICAGGLCWGGISPLNQYIVAGPCTTKMLQGWVALSYTQLIAGGVTKLDLGTKGSFRWDLVPLGASQPALTPFSSPQTWCPRRRPEPRRWSSTPSTPTPCECLLLLLASFTFPSPGSASSAPHLLQAPMGAPLALQDQFGAQGCL